MADPCVAGSTRVERALLPAIRCSSLSLSHSLAIAQSPIPLSFRVLREAKGEESAATPSLPQS